MLLDPLCDREGEVVTDAFKIRAVLGLFALCDGIVTVETILRLHRDIVRQVDAECYSALPAWAASRTMRTMPVRPMLLPIDNSRPKVS